jgi:hypothetical protein
LANGRDELQEKEIAAKRLKKLKRDRRLPRKNFYRTFPGQAVLPGGVAGWEF